MSGGNGRPGLAIPGQTNVNIVHHPTAMAGQSSAVFPTPAGVQVLVLGGLTKLEHTAALAHAAVLGTGVQLVSDEALAKQSVAHARALLAACEAAQRQDAEAAMARAKSPGIVAGGAE